MPLSGQLHGPETSMHANRNHGESETMLQRQLVLNDEILARLQRRYKARGIEMPPNNARQALVPTGAEILDHGKAKPRMPCLAARIRTVTTLPHACQGLPIRW